MRTILLLAVALFAIGCVSTDDPTGATRPSNQSVVAGPMYRALF